MGDWVPVPVVGGAYADDTRPWTAQDTLNYIPVKAERAGGRSSEMLRTSPGFTAFCDTGSEAPVRGARNVEGLYLVVSGNTLFRINPDGTATPLGNIPGVGRVTMAHNQIANGNEVAISNGNDGYVYNTVTNTLSHITDEAFPGFLSVDYVDGYITGIEPGRRYAFHSDLNAALEYSALDRFEVEGSPDALVGQIVDHREWWLFGERTIEPYVNTGQAEGTFERANGTVIEVGCDSAHAIAKLDNSVIWPGGGVIYRANGYTPQRISTHAIEQALSRCNLAQSFAFTYEDRGHKVYYLTCPDGETWGYDIASGEWHRRASYGLKRWRLNTLTRWNGAWYGGDYSNGKIYRLDWDVMNEDGQPLESMRTTGVLHDNQNALTLNGVELVFDTGHGSGVVQARISKDGGHNWLDWRERSLGGQGDFQKRAKFLRYGRGRQFVLQTRVTDNCKRDLLAMSVQIEPAD